MFEDKLALVVAVAALIAAALQTYIRIKSRNEKRTYGKDKWRKPRGAIGDLSVLSTWVTLFLPGHLYYGGAELPGGSRVIGCLILLFAIGLRIWAQILLGHNWSNGAATREGHTLIQSGPYRLMRHPMYTGYCLIAIGGTLTSENFVVVGLWLMFLPMLFERAQLEEEALEEEFGHLYQNYRETTGRFLPRLQTLARSER